MNYNLNKDWVKISKGDINCFESLYHNFYKRLCLYAYSLVSDEFSAEEIVQDVFVNLWENRRNIQIKGSIKAYLFRSVHNQSVNTIKKKLTKKNTVNSTLSEENWNGLENMINFNAYILEGIEAAETEEKINIAIDELPGQCKTIFKLSRIENFSNHEISQKLNLSVHTVRGQLNKAIRKIINRI